LADQPGLSGTPILAAWRLKLLDLRLMRGAHPVMHERIVGMHTIESDVSGAWLPGVSIQEAAGMLGVSISTVRRWCVVGRLKSKRIDRPQGVAIRVFIDVAQAAAILAGEQQAPVQLPEDDVQGIPPQNPVTSELPAMSTGANLLPIPDVPALTGISRAEHSRAEMTVALISATASQVVAPFMREYEVVREAVDRQTNQLRDQAELIGRLSSDLDHAREVIRELKQPDQVSARSHRWVPGGVIIAISVLFLALEAVVIVLLGR
jgi:hypothetical protein